MRVVEQSYEILWFPENPLRTIELAGRIAYKSEVKDEATTRVFVRSLLDRQHDSVIEHGGIATVKFICDRGVSHELVRHRLASFTQESTRYCNYAKDKFNAEISIVLPSSLSREEKDAVIWAARCAESAYMVLINSGTKAQIARAVLPTCLKTEIVMSANLREWRHIFKLRTHPSAHPQMVALMRPLLAEFQQRCPVVFDGI
jgi:thymidylate synthase (FAD)